MNRDFKDDEWTISNCGYCNTHGDHFDLGRLHDIDNPDGPVTHSVLHSGLPRDLVDEILDMESKLATLQYSRQKPNTIDDASITNLNDKTIPMLEGQKVFTKLTGENQSLFDSSPWDQQ